MSSHFFLAERVHAFRRSFSGGFEGLQEFAAHVAVEHGGMDVALAADGGGVAELFGDLLDGLDDVLLRLGLGFEGFEFAQRQAGEDGACPGAKVLGGELLLGDGAQIVVHVGGVDSVQRAVLVVDVLEEFVAGQVEAALHNAREAAVVEVDDVALAALALEFEADRRAFDIDVLVAQRGEAVGVIFLRVLLVADADEGGFEQAHDGGEHLLARQAGKGEVLFDALADDGQRFAEELHAFVLVFVAHLAPARMIAALLAARASRPVACRCPLARGQIHTSVQAGGMARDLMRPSSSLSRIGFPSGSKY